MLWYAVPKRASCPHSSLISYSSRPWAQGRPHRGDSFTFVYRGLERAYLAAAQGRFYQMDLERRWTEAFWIHWRLYELWHIMTKTTKSWSSQPDLYILTLHILVLVWMQYIVLNYWEFPETTESLAAETCWALSCQAKIAKFSSLRTYIPVYHEVGSRGGNFILWTCERDDWKDMEGCWNHDSGTIKRVLAQTDSNSNSNACSNSGWNHAVPIGIIQIPCWKSATHGLLKC